MMKQNVGAADRTIRILVGLFVMSLAFWGPKSPWAYLGLLPLMTGLFGCCGLYSLVGVNTCKRAG